MPTAPAIHTDPPPDWVTERAQLQARIAQLEHQLAWFQRQIFGEKSERRHPDPPPAQLSLGAGLAGPTTDPVSTQPVAAPTRRQVIKRKDDATLHCAAAPAGVFAGGRADVSFLAGLVIDKFLYHLPLYRQHQRLLAAGITVSRQWLTQQVLAVALLLAPIAAA